MPEPNNAPISTRNQPDDEKFQARAAGLSLRGQPSTVDEETRSVEFTIATETPVQVYDYKRWEVVDEILLMSGLRKLPDQIPLLDSHSRWSSNDVLGSARKISVDGDRLVARLYFARDEKSQDIFDKVRDGHLTDVSIGYRVLTAEWVPENESQTIDGRKFDGPVKVVTEWELKEVSTTPIGADEQAKARARAENTTPPNRPKEVKPMNEHLRKLLEARGLSKDATDEEAYRYLDKLAERGELLPGQPDKNEPAGQRASTDPPAAPAQTATNPPADPEQARQEAIIEERNRVSEIREMCRAQGVEDMADAMIQDGTTVSAAQRQVLDRLAARSDRQSDAGSFSYRAPVSMGADEQDKYRAAAEDALLLRIGHPVENPAPGATELRGLTLRESCREYLYRHNLAASGDPMEMVGRALATSDFPKLLAAVADKVLREGWALAPETWSTWCATGSVSDFKTHSAPRAAELDDLIEIPEGGEYKYGALKEEQEQFKVVTYGRIIAFTRQAIINDDLSALSDIPLKHGRAAARKIGDIAYAVLTGNAAMGDGIALFHATHGNLPTAAAIGTASLGAAVLAMKKQTDANGARLNITPEYLLAPVALEMSTETFIQSEFAATQALPQQRNIYHGMWTRVYDPRLDDDDANGWYMAGPKGLTVKVFFLNGNQEPYLETRQGWNVDGVEYKVRIDAGAKAMDWRALTYNEGA